MLHSGGLVSRTISVRLNGHELATITPKTFWSGSRIVVEGVQYELSRTGMLTGDYVLRHGADELARGRKPRFVSRRMQADIGGWVYDLRPQSSFTSKFVVERERQVIGSIGPRPVLRAFPAKLPSDIPTVYQVFMVALVSLMWNRNDD